MRNLQDKRNRLMAEARAILNGGAITPEKREQYDAIIEDLTTVNGDIERRQAFEKIEAEDRRIVNPTRRPDPGASDEAVWRLRPNPGESADFVERREVRDMRQKEDFRHWMRTGERRDLTAGGSTTSITSGVAIPIAFNPQVVEAQLSYGELYNEVEVLKTDSGEPMKWVFDDDTGNGLAAVTVGTDASETDPTLTGATLNVDNLTTGVIKVDMGLLNDAGFDVDAWVRERFAMRFFRGASSLIYSGNTGNIASLKTVIPATGVGQSFTSAASGALGYADFAKALGQLDPASQQNAVWAMHSATLGYVAGLTDTVNGRPLFLPDFGSASKGFPGTILGKPVRLVQQMDNTIVAGKVPVYFGDFKKAYVFRQVNPGIAIIRLNERYAPAFEVGFVGFARVGGMSKIVGAAKPVLSITIKA
jgi:HK97 family phage major capsid protein